MVIRQRAIQAEDKEMRHSAILDAAQRLLAPAPDRVPNMADVADEAGLAKGTVYLYFPSKEELLLALHERNIDEFFRPLIERLEQRAPFGIDDMLALTRRHMIDPPLFLPLASRCFGLMAQSMPMASAVAFKQRMGERLQRAGSGLERHFPDLRAGDGVALLRHSYALILGLWQMSASAGGGVAACGAPSVALPPQLVFRFPDDLERALTALWRGTVGRPTAVPAPHPAAIPLQG
jgi:AcrR family transcriptional regulator